MKHTRQITLLARLDATIRALPGVLAAALVFSLVFFSPLIDMKDTIAAAAQGRSDNSNGNGNNGGGGGNSGGNSSSNSSSGNGGNGSGNSSSGSSSPGNSGSAPGHSGSSPGNSGSAPGNSASFGGPATSGGFDAATPAVGNFLQRIFGGSQFVGDSEPSGKALTEREEREAIRNGWK